MALIQCDFISETLGISTSMNVILPQGQINRPFQTLYLLHGLSDDHTGWCRRTSIERYADNQGIAVVMPAVNRSFYADMSRGAKYWTFISEELPRLARSFFPLSDRREDNFVAGLSMGGYGAMKLALSFPDRYAAAASLSGSVDISRLAAEEYGGDMWNIFSDPAKVSGSSADLFALADLAALAAGDGLVPMLYQCCGTEDFLYEDNVRFRDHCRQLGLPVTYEEEHGNHDWSYWDHKIARVLEWLPIKRD
ncbi:alpha/beta hydrolase [Cohnella mopanensis]|uniref:alpha/beta hydrolase n=1 Tax=Cohnella mopanensis TaxID=2911966 RepID=UPI001EF9738F|nr:alpha/beta hydrolase family protein [Cohnella mopanensis]